MENRTVLFQGKEINLDDEPGEMADMIHHPDHYTWKGVECKKIIEIMTSGLSGAEAYYWGTLSSTCTAIRRRARRSATWQRRKNTRSSYGNCLWKMEGKHECSYYFRATDP